MRKKLNDWVTIRMELLCTEHLQQRIKIIFRTFLKIIYNIIINNIIIVMITFWWLKENHGTIFPCPVGAQCEVAMAIKVTSSTEALSSKTPQMR